MSSSVSFDVDPRQLIGAVLSQQYQLVELQRDDTTAATFSGVNLQTGAGVVVKLLKHELVDDGAFAQPFLKTLRGLCGLTHPNIVDVIDYGNTEDGAIYVIAEHDPGDSLMKMFERTLQFDWPEARAVGLQLIAGLRAAHARGAAHRALRPTCCLLGGEANDTIRIADFGLLQPRVSDASAPTDVLHYLAPEVVLGEDADARVDIYGVGAILYRMLEGRPPVSGKYTQVSMQHNLASKPRLRKRSGVTPAVIAFVQQALARNPDDRFASMAELDTALSELGEHGFRRERTPSSSTSEGVTPVAGDGPTQGSAVFYSLDSLRGSLADAKTPAEKLAICDKIERALKAMGGSSDDVAMVKWRELLATTRAAAGQEQADTLKKARRWKELAQLLEQRVEQAADDRARVPLLSELGELYAGKLADLTPARTCFERLIGIYEQLGEGAIDNQTMAATWLALGKLYERTGNYEDAIAATDYYLQLHQGLSPEEQAEQLTRLAKILEEKLDDTDAAATRLLHALNLAPKHLEAAHRLVALLKLRGDFPGMVRHLEHIVRYETSGYRRSKAACEAALIFRDMLNEPDKAIVMYELALEHDPENLEIGSNLANLYLHTGNAGNAAPILELLVRRIDKLGLAPDAQLELCLRAAQTQAALGKREPALKLFRRAQKLDPNNRGALLGEADVLFEAKRWDAAYECYRKLIAPTKTPQSGRSVAAIYWRLSQIKKAQNEPEEALKYLKKAVGLDPKNTETLEALLFLQTRARDYPGMAKTLGQLAKLEQGGDLFRRLRQLGEIQRDHLNQPSKALETFEKAAAIDADDVPLLLGLVDLHRKRKDWPGVLRALDRLIAQETDPAKRARYHYSAAVIQRDEVRDLDTALKRFDDVLRDDPSLLKAFQAIDTIMTRRKDWKALERAYRKMIMRSSKAGEARIIPMLWSNLGEIYRSRIGDYPAAIKAYGMGLQQDPQNLKWHSIQCELYEKLARQNPNEYTPKWVAKHNEIIQVEPAHYDSYHALFNYYNGTRQVDKAYCVARTLVFMKRANPAEQQLAAKYPNTGLKAIRQKLDDTIVANHIMPAECSRSITQIMGLLANSLANWRALSLTGSLAQADPVNLNYDSFDNSKALLYVLGALGVQPPRVYYTPNESGNLRMMNVSQGGQAFRAFVVTRNLLKAQVGMPDRVFTLARHCLDLFSPLLAFHVIGRSRGNLKELLVACRQLSGHAVGERSAGVHAAVRELGKAPGQRLAQVKQVIDNMIETGEVVDVKAWAHGASLAGYRLGLLLCDDLGTAARMLAFEEQQLGSSLARKDVLKGLIQYSISEQYFAARAHLGLRVA